MGVTSVRYHLLITMLQVVLLPIILGITPLSLFPVSATPAAFPTTSAAPGQIGTLYDSVERSVVKISPKFREFDIFSTPLPTENTAQGYGSGFVFDEQGHI